MVDITPPVLDGKQLIERYGDQQFLISGKVYHSLVLVCETETHEVPSTNLESILSEYPDLILSRVMVARPGSILIIGTGEKIVWFRKEMLAPFKDAGLIVELMNTGAACRTFNVLQSESRDVSALLLPVQ